MTSQDGGSYSFFGSSRKRKWTKWQMFIIQECPQFSSYFGDFQLKRKTFYRYLLTISAKSTVLSANKEHVW